MTLERQEFLGAVGAIWGGVAGRDITHHIYGLGRQINKAELSKLRRLVQQLESRRAAVVAAAALVRKRFLWSSALAGLASCLVMVLSWHTYELRGTIRGMEARQSLCVLEAKAYSIGSRISGNDVPMLTCTPGERGTAEWQQVSEPNDQA